MKSVIEKVAFYNPELAEEYIRYVDEEFSDNLHPTFKEEVFRVMDRKGYDRRIYEVRIQDAAPN